MICYLINHYFQQVLDQFGIKIGPLVKGVLCTPGTVLMDATIALHMPNMHLNIKTV